MTEIYSDISGMSSCTAMRLQSAKAVAIVEEVKELTNELTIAISQDEYMNKFCFHGVITDRAKYVEQAKEKFMIAAEKLETLTDQLTLAKEQLHNINLQYQRFLDENTTLENTIESIKSGDYLGDNERKRFNESRLKLNMYKMMTGVYFDLNDNSNSELSGFIAVKGDAKTLSGLVPFTFDREQDVSAFLWDKIGEALHEDKENMFESTAKQFQQKLEIK